MCKAKSKFSVPVTAQGTETMATGGDGLGRLPIYDLDPKLAGFKDHFDYRMKRYLDQKQSIEQHEGSLEEFAKG
jgi:1,4-alpha-glucan branching enzyme